MGRKKEYDRDELIQKALGIFRIHGYAGTSTQMLVEGLEVNRFSLYAEFSNKQELFNAVLERYDEQIVNRNFGPLEQPTAGTAEIRSLLDFFAKASAGPVAGKGCLLCNTAVEFGPTDPTGRAFVERYFHRISQAYRNALANARDRGEIAESTSIAEEADFFTASTVGLFILIRAKAAPSTITNAATMAIRHLTLLAG